MIKDGMIDEIQELKLSGYSFPEARDELRRRHTKVPCEKTLRKYYNMDAAPDDSHAKVRKAHAFDEEPFRTEILCILEMNPGCYMSSVYDVLIEKFVESGQYEILPGNEQTLRNYIRHLRESGQIAAKEEHRRLYDVMPTPDPGKKAQIDFGQYDCGDGLVVHFICIVLWHSRLLGVYAQDHKFSSEESCRALHRFTVKCGGRVEELVIDQDSVFVTDEIYGEVFETKAFKDFLHEQDMRLWVCRKADPESKGCIENAVGFVKKRFFSARRFKSIDEVQRSLPAWVERANRRIHQGTYKVPQEEFEKVERQALRPMLPSVCRSTSGRRLSTDSPTCCTRQSSTRCPGACAIPLPTSGSSGTSCTSTTRRGSMSARTPSARLRGPSSGSRSTGGSLRATGSTRRSACGRGGTAWSSSIS